MGQSAYLLLGLTAIVGALTAILVFAMLRLAAAARNASRDGRDTGMETAFMAAAVEEAIRKLREQERAMKARAEASERLSDEIVASLTSGLLVVGTNDEVRTVNPAAIRLLGLPEGGWSGSYRDVLGNALPLADAIAECLATRRPIVRRALHMEAAPAALGPSHLGVTVSPVFGAQEELQGAICLFTDLSAVVDLEEQLRLKDSLAKLGELTAGIAHEFRNGLATIHGYSRLLDLRELPERYRPCVEGIRKEADALGQVVANFLNFARPAKLTLSPVDLQTLADRAAGEIRADVSARGGTVTVRGDFGVVQGDEILLRQALSNLCRNALEACSEAGVAPAIVLEGAIDADGRAARVTVSDNGPGIPPAAADRIFRPFFTTKAGGTGLGLALVQKIVVTHNGRVTAAASPEGGARLQVVLPLA